MTASQSAAGAEGPAPGHSKQKRAWWTWTKRVGAWVFFGLVAWLLVNQARTIDWGEVFDALGQMPMGSLVMAGLLAAGSHALYSTYDLLGRRMTGHHLGTGAVMNVTFISYAFNLNFGSFIGGGGSRYRLYSRLGLNVGTITRVWAFSMLTNWIGYLAVGGAAFAFWPMALPPDWKIGSEGLRILGAGMLLAAVGYLVLCAVAREHVWRFREHELQTPPWHIALLQIGLSGANWSVMGATIWLLLQQQAAYPHALAVLLVAAVAGVIVHIPAGLGVLEAVFVALLAYEIPQAQLLAALLAYRALYYLLPLIVAAAAFVVTEVHAKKIRQTRKSKHSSAS